MKLNKILITTAVGIVASLVAYQSAVAKKGGTSILHFMVRDNMEGTGADSDASGSVNAKRNQQGNADNQRLTIATSNLDSDATYTLLALLGDDLTLTEIGTFNTDAAGAAVLDYVHKGQGKASPHGDPLPNVLDPISQIRSFEIANSNAVTVLTADLTDPDKLQYLIKRMLTNDNVDQDAEASLRIKATADMTQFRVRASNLDPTNTYFLAINDAVSDTGMSDLDGDLEFNGLPGGSPAPLDITGVAIWNATSNSVLSTTLP